MTLQTIDPVTAKRLIDDGAVLVDIREPDEHAREHVPGARNTPLSRLDSLPADAKAIVFHCRSGARTSGNAARLAAAADCGRNTGRLLNARNAPVAPPRRRKSRREAVVWWSKSGTGCSGMQGLHWQPALRRSAPAAVGERRAHHGL